MWDAVKAVLRGEFIVINTYIKKNERSEVKNLTLYLKELGKEEQTKPKVNRRKEITKIRLEINEIVTRKTIEEISKTRVGFLKK